MKIHCAYFIDSFQRLRMIRLLWIYSLTAMLIISANLSLASGHAKPTLINEMYCNRTFTIPSTSPFGSLHYTHNAEDDSTCTITIETMAGHRIGFFFRETSAYQTIRFDDNDVIFYSCRTLVQLADGSHRLSNKRCVFSDYNDTMHATKDNRLKIEVTGDDVTAFSFDLLFYSFHEGACEQKEQKCSLMNDFTTLYDVSVCIHDDIVCNNEFNVCNSSETKCSHFEADDNELFVTSTALTVFLSAVLILAVGIFCIFKVKQSFCKSNIVETREDINTHARASSGSAMADMYDNSVIRSFETIDFNKFDPPPEYSTLEISDLGNKFNVSNITESRKSVVSLPRYSDVMKNCGEYSVASHL